MARDEVRLTEREALELAGIQSEENVRAWLAAKGIDPARVCGKQVNLDGTVVLRLQPEHGEPRYSHIKRIGGRRSPGSAS